MIKAIFFDFNGIIIDDERLQMAAYQEVLKKRDIELTEAQYFAALGMDDETFVRVALERVGRLSDQLVQDVLNDKLVAHRKLIEDELPLFPGVVTFIKAASREFSLGIVSMASAEEVNYVFERANLGSYFSVVVTADDVHICKPAPACYTKAFQKLNELRQTRRQLPLISRECLVIEDSPPGIDSGRTAGMCTLGVTNTVSEELLRAAGAEVVTRSLADWTTDAVRLVFGLEQAAR
jgi:phosphoglycolate phosphatase/beta-phosphoglucomutase